MIAPEKSCRSPMTEVRESPISGRGLFATGFIPAGEMVVRFGGYYTNQKEAKEAEKNGKLVMRWDTDLFSVEDIGKDEGYFINHSCDSDLWMTDAFTLVARRNIYPKQEITVDYALWEEPHYLAEWLCNCKKPNCRKRITGQDYKKVADDYKNHFSPFINKLLYWDMLRVF